MAFNLDKGKQNAKDINSILSDINQKQEAGYKSITWHGVDSFGMKVGAGMYFYVIQADNFRQVKKMVLLK